jgi:hypothetical protein
MAAFMQLGRESEKILSHIRYNNNLYLMQHALHTAPCLTKYVTPFFLMKETSHASALAQGNVV